MKGLLFDDFFVEVDPGVMSLRGAWEQISPLRAGHRPLLRFFYGKLKKLENPVMLDIGASTGSFCLLAAFHEMKVHAFEPNPEAYKFLERNIALNKLEDKIIAYRWALSNVDKKAYLRVPVGGDPSMSTLGKPKLFKKWHKVKVWVRRLDSLDLGHVDVMKIDTEGNEYNVLLGAEETIREYKPQLLLEYDPLMTAQFGYKPQKIRELLESWGYSYFQLQGKRETDIWAEWQCRFGIG